MVLSVAANALKTKGHFARAAQKFGAAAVAAAQELASPAGECLVVAYLQLWQAYCMSCHCAVPTMSLNERMDALRTACELFTPYIPMLRRHEAAGTLLPGRCRPAEVAWFRTHQFRIFDGDSASAHMYADAVAERVGVETYCIAACAVYNVVLYVDGAPQLLYTAFLACALDLLASLPGEPIAAAEGTVVSYLEVTLACSVRRLIHSGSVPRYFGDAAGTVLTDAWQRLERSGVLERRLLGHANRSIEPSAFPAKLATVAVEAALRGLHTCALSGCSATEVHVSQFKKCGACKTVAYCCKEHQVEDWPAHKAACKTARKSGAAKDNA
jgi:hypothetical protein